jgi:quinol monooxygenase YgiN
VKGFTIIVVFTVKPGAMAAFRALVDANARASCRNEAGCRRFDVLAPAGEDARVVLYEIYDDRAAFAAHLASAHYAAFNRDSAAHVAEKRVVEYDLLCEGSA